MHGPSAPFRPGWRIAFLLFALASGCGQEFSCTESPVIIGTLSEADTREAVVGASDRLIQALSQENAAGLRDLMSQQRGFQAVANGETYGAEPFLRAINAQRFPVPSADRSGLALSEFTINPAGEAVATYAGEGQLYEGGKRVRAGAYTLRMIWFNEGGTWRVSRIELGMQSKRGGSIGW